MDFQRAEAERASECNPTIRRKRRGPMRSGQGEMRD
jgi:hypothetical protein